jgi:hypothetical protein
MRERALSGLLFGTARVTAAVFFLFVFAANAGASVRPEDAAHLGRARLIAPSEGERLGAAAVRFAYELPKDAAESWLIVARAPFDPAGWRELPQDPAFARIDAARGLRDLDALGLSIDRETRLYWTVLTRDRGRGELRASEVRSFTAQPRFVNRVAPSPFLGASRTGALTRAELEEAWSTARADLLGTQSAGSAITAPPRIRLSAGYEFAPSAGGAPALAPEWAAPRALPEPVSGSGLASYLVQFSEPPSEQQRDALARAGAAVFAYVPDQAFLVRMSPAARERAIVDAGAAWVGDYLPAYKMSPLFADATVPKAGSFYALLFPDAPAAEITGALAARGFVVQRVSDNGINRLVRFSGPDAELARVAGLSGVAWVEPVVPKTIFNDLAQWVVQTFASNNRRVWSMGITGAGQVVMTSDSGINVTHDQFKDLLVPIADFGDTPTHRKIIAYKLGSTDPIVQFGDHGGTNSYHGTHTGCTLAGNDSTIAASARDGMAKDAKIYFMDVGGTALANGVIPFDDLNDLFLPPYIGNAGGAARLSSNSWGAAVSGKYDLSALQCDQFTWAHPDFYLAFSNGNAGTGGSVGSPASAKNVVGVGGTRNGASANLIYTPTSRGPTADGRRKPMICAPGQLVISAQAAPSSYAALSGTSMASPAATGAVTLMRQYLADGWYPTGAPVPANGFSPTAALLKAMAINAGDGPVSASLGPDNNIGYGRVLVDNALFFPGDARKLLLVDHTQGLTQGLFIEYQIQVTDGSIPLEVSLAWTDYPGNPAASVQLVNNLDLSVTNGIVTYKGNVFASGFSITGGSADVLNVEENVRVNAPPTGLWTVRVLAPTIPVGPQPFALCLTGGVGQQAGALALDRAEYGSSSTVEIQVTDVDAIEPVVVDILSPTEGGGEQVTLTGGDGVWTGSITLSPLNPVSDDGVLAVSHGDQIDVTYADANPISTLLASASVSLATPVITDVGATSQGSEGTLLTWQTSLNATGRVYYGLTPALELGAVDGDGARVSHQILLTGLTPGTTYYYDVEATSLFGNTVRDDLGGAHYRFTAQGSGDFLLLLGDPGFPRLTTWESSLQALGYDTDVWSGPLADDPVLGDVNSGLRSYTAVIFQAGFETYPPFSDVQRQRVTDYIDGGGRLWAIGHDIAWALGDPTSPVFSVDRQTWLANTLRTVFQADPLLWNQMLGEAGDPISDPYVAGVLYQPFRDGGAGDEIDVTGAPGGTTGYVWSNNDPTPDDCAFRWESAVSNGSAATSRWGGTPSKFVAQYFEFTALAPPFTSPSATRDNVLDRTLRWLLGRDRPQVAVTEPNGGETLTGNSAQISWTESVAGGLSVAERSIEFSLDGGDSWTLLSTSPGTSPYTWDLTSVPNSPTCLVRVRIADDGTPAPLRRTDTSDAVFTIQRTGGDLAGPVVVAGSIETSPNPIVRPNGATLEAQIDETNTGGSGVAAAEWSIGVSPAAAGSGTATGGGFGGNLATATIALDTTPFQTGAQTLWVRGQDGAGNWGPARSLSVQVNGPDVVASPNVPRAAFLAQNTPNPFLGATQVRFGLPVAATAEVRIFAASGRLVKRVLSGSLPAGEHVATWDGTDESGARVSAGVYYYELSAGSAKLRKKALLLSD